MAISGADAEFSKVSTAGARINAEKAGLNIVYDKSYPPSTTDFGPIVRAIQSADADIVYNASYPLDTVGIVRAAHEAGLKTKMFGGNMIGLLAAVFKKQLGPLLNGVVSTADTFVPAPSFDFPGVEEVLQKYQERAVRENADPLGYQYAPYGYAAMQLLAEAVEATNSLDQAKLADYIHSHSFKTVVGEIAFGPDGEWVKPRLLVSQYQNVEGNDLEQFRDFKKQVILWPPELKSGSLSTPTTRPSSCSGQTMVHGCARASRRDAAKLRCPHLLQKGTWLCVCQSAPWLKAGPPGLWRRRQLPHHPVPIQINREPANPVVGVECEYGARPYLHHVMFVGMDAGKRRREVRVTARKPLPGVSSGKRALDADGVGAFCIKPCAPRASTSSKSGNDFKS